MTDRRFTPDIDDEDDDYRPARGPSPAELEAREQWGWPGSSLPDDLAADLAEELYDVPDPRLVNDD